MTVQKLFAITPKTNKLRMLNKMIDGVTILEKIEIMSTNMNQNYFLTNFFLPAIVTFALGVFVCLVTLDDERFIPIVLIVIGWFSFTFIPMFFNSLEKQTPTGRYIYRCVVDESVSIEELQEKYYIREKDGDIYILEDKTSVE